MIRFFLNIVIVLLLISMMYFLFFNVENMKVGYLCLFVLMVVNLIFFVKKNLKKNPEK